VLKELGKKRGSVQRKKTYNVPPGVDLAATIEPPSLRRKKSETKPQGTTKMLQNPRPVGTASNRKWVLKKPDRENDNSWRKRPIIGNESGHL